MNKDKRVMVQRFNSIKDNDVKPSQRLDITWSDFVKYCSEPTIVLKKEDAKLITPVEFHQDKDDITERGFPRRCRNNVKTWTMLPIDVDKTLTIRQALVQFKDYEYVLYTSFNHQLQKGDEEPCDRFRLFFLLEEPVENEEFMLRRKSLKQFVEFLDPTSLSVSRAFYEPSCSEATYEDSMFYHNTGKALNVMDFEPEIIPVFIPDKNHNLNDEFKEQVLELLPQIGTVDYDVWWKIGSAMIDGGYTFDQFCNISCSLRAHRADRNCKAQWSSSKRKPISFGYLVNLIRDKMGSDCFKKENSTYSDVDREIISLYAKIKQLKRQGA